MPAELENMIGDGTAIHVARQTTGNVSVGREGVLVTLKIGNATVRFKHQDAMRIGQWLLAKGNEAKLLAGDTARLQV